MLLWASYPVFTVETRRVVLRVMVVLVPLAVTTVMTSGGTLVDPPRVQILMRLLETPVNRLIPMRLLNRVVVLLMVSPMAELLVPVLSSLLVEPVLVLMVQLRILLSNLMNPGAPVMKLALEPSLMVQLALLPVALMIPEVTAFLRVPWFLCPLVVVTFPVWTTLPVWVMLFLVLARVPPMLSTLVLALL